MDITWICKSCGAVNSASSDSCSECNSEYASAPRESVTNQAFVNHGVVFNNAVISPQPTVDEMLGSIEEFYNIDGEEEEPEEPREDFNFGMWVFTWTCNILMWIAIAVSASVILFIVAIVIAAFCKM
jgi:hypothetical protein